MPPTRQRLVALRRRSACTWVLIAVIAGLVATACSVSGSPAAPIAERSSVTTAPPGTPAATSQAAQLVAVTVTCDTNGRRPVQIAGPDELPGLWQQKATFCEATRNSAPLTALEQQAVTAAGYESPTSVKTLYGLCAQASEASAYLVPGFSASAAQAKEIAGMLLLCPNHPFAGRLQQAARRGHSDAQAEATGELFAGGTYRVGEQIKPGTYAIEGNIKNCYWERTDRNGKTIENDFVVAAKRVQVTIRGTDYAFTSDGCGTWRKIR